MNLDQLSNFLMEEKHIEVTEKGVVGIKITSLEELEAGNVLMHSLEENALIMEASNLKRQRRYVEANEIMKKCYNTFGATTILYKSWAKLLAADNLFDEARHLFKLANKIVENATGQKDPQISHHYNQLKKSNRNNIEKFRTYISSIAGDPSWEYRESLIGKDTILVDEEKLSPEEMVIFLKKKHDKEIEEFTNKLEIIDEENNRLRSEISLYEIDKKKNSLLVKEFNVLKNNNEKVSNLLTKEKRKSSDLEAAVSKRNKEIRKLKKEAQSIEKHVEAVKKRDEKIMALEGKMEIQSANLEIIKNNYKIKLEESYNEFVMENKSIKSQNKKLEETIVQLKNNKQYLVENNLLKSQVEIFKSDIQHYKGLSKKYLIVLEKNGLKNFKEG